MLTTKRLTFMGALRTSDVKLGDIISLQSYSDGIQIHRERKQKAETYLLGQSLQILEGSGEGLTVNGVMIEAAIGVAKLISETPTEVLAAVAEQQQADPPRWPYVEYRRGDCREFRV